MKKLRGEPRSGCDPPGETQLGRREQSRERGNQKQQEEKTQRKRRGENTDLAIRRRDQSTPTISSAGQDALSNSREK